MTGDRARIASHFDRKAASFDAIYSGDKPRLLRIWDRLTRRNLSERFDFALAELEPVVDRRILDVGCGSGRYSVELAARGAEVLGVDLSARMLEIARGLARARGQDARCRFEQADVMSLGDIRGFDHAVAMGFFDYTHDAGPILSSLRRMVRDRMAASFPARWSARVPFRALWLALHGCPVRFYDAGEIRTLCEAAGFEVLTLRRSGPIYLLLARAC